MKANHLGSETETYEKLYGSILDLHTVKDFPAAREKSEAVEQKLKNVDLTNETTRAFFLKRVQFSRNFLRASPLEYLIYSPLEHLILAAVGYDPSNPSASLAACPGPLVLLLKDKENLLQTSKLLLIYQSLKIATDLIAKGQYRKAFLEANKNEADLIAQSENIIKELDRLVANHVKADKLHPRAEESEEGAPSLKRLRREKLTQSIEKAKEKIKQAEEELALLESAEALSSAENSALAHDSKLNLPLFAVQEDADKIKKETAQEETSKPKRSSICSIC